MIAEFIAGALGNTYYIYSGPSAFYFGLLALVRAPNSHFAFRVFELVVGTRGMPCGDAIGSRVPLPGGIDSMDITPTHVSHIRSFGSMAFVLTCACTMAVLVRGRWWVGSKAISWEVAFPAYDVACRMGNHGGTHDAS